MDVVDHAIEEPQWLKTLSERVVESFNPTGIMGPLGYRFIEPTDEYNPHACWVVVFYPTPNEAHGGKHDGSKIIPGFSLDLAHLLDGFSEVTAIVWNAPVGYNGELDGPEVSIRGAFVGNAVWVRIFSLPPHDEEPVLVVDLASGDAWERKVDQ